MTDIDLRTKEGRALKARLEAEAHGVIEPAPPPEPAEDQPPVAQLAEPAAHNDLVAGSSPAGSTTDEEASILDPDDEPEPLGEEWVHFQPISTAPKDGKPLVLTDGKTEMPAVWRKTRAYDASSTSWKETALWAIHNGGGRPLPFEPVGWRPSA